MVMTLLWISVISTMPNLARAVRIEAMIAQGRSEEDVVPRERTIVRRLGDFFLGG
jgi:hypothetical protein